MSLMCNFGVHSRLLDVIYGLRPLNGSPEVDLKILNSEIILKTFTHVTIGIHQWSWLTDHPAMVTLSL